MKKVLVVLMSLVIIFTACIMPVYAAPPTGGKKVPVTGVSLNVKDLTLEAGQTQTLTATVSPQSATNKNVTWLSSNPSVATVDVTGQVKAIAAGTATITVKTAERGYTDTCTVTVVARPPTVVPVTGVSINPNALTLAVNQTQTLSAAVLPLDATNKTVTWTSSDDTTASVDFNTGLVTAIKVGTAAITVTTADGLKTNTCIVTVTSPPASINYVALGDSIATGTVYPGKVIDTYVKFFSEYLKTQNNNAQINLTNLTTNGYRTNELFIKLGLDSAPADTAYVNAIQNADIITLCIGGNNLMQAAKDSSKLGGYDFNKIDSAVAEQGVRDFNSHWVAIISNIRELNSDAQVIVTTVYNPYNEANAALHNLVDSYLFRTDKTGINDLIYSKNDNALIYDIADIYVAFDSNYSNNMGAVTYFYPTDWWGRLTRNPHPNETGQNILTDLHIQQYKQIQ